MTCVHFLEYKKQMYINLMSHATCTQSFKFWYFLDPEKLQEEFIFSSSLNKAHYLQTFIIVPEIASRNKHN